jgi:hypothetical protein
MSSSGDASIEALTDDLTEDITTGFRGSPMKTEASQKPVPMDGALATALHDWNRQAPYRQPEDWVFASPSMNGRQPYWPETPLKCFLQPAAKRLGIAETNRLAFFPWKVRNAAERQR